MITRADKSILNLGANTAIIAAIATFICTICIGLDPLGLVGGAYTMDTLLKTNLSFTTFWRSLFAVFGILNVAFILAAFKFFRLETGELEGFLLWITIIAIASGIINCMNWVHYINVGDQYQSLSKEGVDVAPFINNPVFPIDSYYLWSFGVLGIYYIIISFFGIKGKKIPLNLSVWGIITGIICLSTSLVYMLRLYIPLPNNGRLSLVLIAGGLTGAIFGPVFYIRISRYFRIKAKENQE
jgi:hypothetical protein